MSLIWRSSLLRWQNCHLCPGAPKFGCGSCGKNNFFRSRCGCVPCIQVPLDNRIVFRNDCCKRKKFCCDEKPHCPCKSNRRLACSCSDCQ